MSTDDLSPLITSAREPLAAPADPSEDELARDWSLTASDLAEIIRCRGDDHRRRFALQLCMLRAHGRFLDDYRRAPIKIVNQLSRQLNLAPVLRLDPPGRAQTERAQTLRIRRHLDLRSFDRPVAADLREWLRQGAIEGRTAPELMARAEDRLRASGVMLPAVSTLERLVASEAAQATTQLYDKVSSRLPEPLRVAIDILVEVPEGDARSSLFHLKDYPRSVKAKVIRGDIIRLRLIEDLLDTGAKADAGLDDLDPRIVRKAASASQAVRGHESGRRRRGSRKCRSPCPLRRGWDVRSGSAARCGARCLRRVPRSRRRRRCGARSLAKGPSG